MGEAKHDLHTNEQCCLTGGHEHEGVVVEKGRRDHFLLVRPEAAQTKHLTEHLARHNITLQTHTYHLKKTQRQTLKLTNT